MRCTIFALFATVMLAAPVADAHHSGVMFDRTRTVTLAGTVKEYQFSNPHVWIEVMVPDPTGREVQWSIEGEGPPIMVRLGLGRTRLKPGDAVTLRTHPLRDGRPGGSFIDITLPDGTLVTSNFGRPPAPPAAQ